jgi:prepilin-type N-terminal cleavage/methylation domain-containing protein
MKTIRDRLAIAQSGQDGLSLVEVIVAIAIVSIVALASASLTFNGLATAAAQTRTQVAITIANGAMETVSGWSIEKSPSTGVSGVYTGRTAAVVGPAFTKYAAQPGVSDTVPGSDLTAPACGAAPALCGAIPISQPVKEGSTNYIVATLIGTCYQSTVIASPQPATPCTTTGGAATTPLIRVIVIVTWTAGSRCATSGCSYATSTLLDPNTDLQWESHV